MHFAVGLAAEFFKDPLRDSLTLPTKIRITR
jgi:hypothetical protein